MISFFVGNLVLFFLRNSLCLILSPALKRRINEFTFILLFSGDLSRVFEFRLSTQESLLVSHLLFCLPPPPPAAAAELRKRSRCPTFPLPSCLSCKLLSKDRRGQSGQIIALFFGDSGGGDYKQGPLVKDLVIGETGSGEEAHPLKQRKKGRCYNEHPPPSSSAETEVGREFKAQAHIFSCPPRITLHKPFSSSPLKHYSITGNPPRRKYNSCNLRFPPIQNSERKEKKAGSN